MTVKEQLKEIVGKHYSLVTLVYEAKDEEYNQAVVLKEVVDSQHVCVLKKQCR